MAESKAKKAVKKEEIDSDDDRPLSHAKLKKKTPSKSPKNVENGSDDKPLAKNLKEKKVKEELKYADDEEPKGDKQRKAKKNKVVEKKLEGKGDIIKKPRKEKIVYELPGQKHDPPEERDPLRIFYETLYEQIPDSEMAAIWMMEWGLLPREEAMKVYEMKQGQKLSLPTKTSSTTKTKTISVVKKVEKVTTKTVSKSHKRKAGGKNSDIDGDDDDFKPLRKKQKSSS